MDSDHASWLAQTVEEAIEPDLPICDPHHHLWADRNGRYLWEDFAADTGSGHRVEKTVFAECLEAYRPDGPEELRPVGESEFAASQSEASRSGGGPVIAGIVAHADLALGKGVAEVLEGHGKVAAGLLRGIRQSAAWDADPAVSTYAPVPQHLLAQPSFRAGLSVLASYGYTYDAWVYHPQIPEVTALARAVPEATVVLDHIGGPLGIGPYARRRDEVREVWRPAMAELATCPNVVVKLGGIGMNRYGLRWQDHPAPPTGEELAAAWEPDLVWCIEHFGPERCMFESNFPVDRESTSYVVLWNAFKLVAAGASPDEKGALFHDTAVRVYHLEDT